LFETVLVEDGRIRLFDRHLLRLRRSGARPRQISAVRALADTWRRTATSPVIVRFDVSPGAPVGSRPRAPSPADPVRLATVPGHDPADDAREQKRAERGWATRAEAAATAAGADAPLLVSAGGLVGETSRASFFAIDATGRVATPPVSGILPGVTRAWALEAIRGDEVALRTADLAGVRAAFLTTAGRGIVPVTAIDGRPLGTDPRVEQLAVAWQLLR
jgi:branched-subunit amino acid aminotransferase/4-amino-4-deoxychorismate lyase